MDQLQDVEKAVEVQNNESAQALRGHDSNYGSDNPVPPGAGGEATTFQAEEQSPPTYDSLYGKIKASKRESSGTVEFFQRLFTLFLGTLGCTISLGLLLAIPISMTAMGAKYLHACPREHYIPIYLIVAGVFGIVKSLSDLAQRIKNKRDKANDKNARVNPVDGVLNCFLFAWFIAGNVWIYRIYNDYDQELNPENPERYCHHTFYLFAFWMTTSTYIILLSLCCCFCLTGIILGVCFAN